MGFVPVTQRSQAKTTGINGQLKIGRTSSTTTEYDVKDAKIDQKYANQDKTGSKSKGFQDSEVGVIGYTLSGTLINHVATPIDLTDENNKYYCDYVVDGCERIKGYFRLTQRGSSFAAAGDHTITFTAESCYGEESGVAVLPSYTAYAPA